VKSSKVL